MSWFRRHLSVGGAAGRGKHGQMPVPRQRGAGGAVRSGTQGPPCRGAAGWEAGPLASRRCRYSPFPACRQSLTGFKFTVLPAPEPGGAEGGAGLRPEPLDPTLSLRGQPVTWAREPGAPASSSRASQGWAAGGGGFVPSGKFGAFARVLGPPARPGDPEASGSPPALSACLGAAG